MKSILLAIAFGAIAAAPAGAATATLSACTTPNAAAHVIGEPFVEMPTIALEQGITGTATVQIELNDKGALLSQALAASSGNRWLDAAAMQSARMTQFGSEMRDCESVAGTYLYAVQF